jgi:hypothetical protein
MYLLAQAGTDSETPGNRLIHVSPGMGRILDPGRFAQAGIGLFAACSAKGTVHSS